MTRDALMRHAAAHVTEELFPETLAMAGVALPLKYRFAPGQPGDGLTLTVPLALLNQIDAARLSWLVPGMIREKVTLLLKALPKGSRNRLAPLPDAVTAFLEAVPYGSEALLTDALRGWLRQRLGEAPPRRTSGTDAAMPAHLDDGDSRHRRGGPRARGRAAISPRCARSSARPRSFRSPRPDPRSSSADSRPGPSATCRRRCRP